MALLSADVVNVLAHEDENDDDDEAVRQAIQQTRLDEIEGEKMGSIHRS